MEKSCIPNQYVSSSENRKIQFARRKKVLSAFCIGLFIIKLLKNCISFLYPSKDDNLYEEAAERKYVELV